MKEKINILAQKIFEDQKAVYMKRYPRLNPDHEARTKVIYGRKYTKIDVGSSGKYMIDSNGNIFGIKAYGVIHRGKKYGTLDTINNYFWGEYAPLKIKKEVKP